MNYRRVLTVAIGGAALITAGIALRVPQWTAKAASTIFSSPVSNVIEAYRVPYESIVPFSSCIPSPSFSCSITFAEVPFNQRLTVKSLTIRLELVTGTAIWNGSISDPNRGTGQIVDEFSVTPNANNDGFYQSDKLLYFNTSISGPPTLTFKLGQTGTLFGTSGGPTGLVDAYLTGYLDNCLAYPGGVCPAIVQ